MNDQSSKSLVPHFTIGAIVVLIILIVLLWPSEPTLYAPETEPTIESLITTPIAEPEVEPAPTFEAPPAVTEFVESEPESTPEPEPEPEPLDVSDGTVKTKLLSLSDYDAFARLLINDALLERFVVMTTTLANEDIAANNRVLTQPEKPFRTYRQADKDWIDPASYKRYTPYVDVFESLEVSSLLALYEEYKPAINDIFAEIGNPNDSFDDKLSDAIDILLDTPEVPVPVEVYTDSVMFKYADERIEALSAPQKQLLRTGPENMRRIKAKLREIQSAL
ncbi:DUF3014 domain-containing protein [Paraglaciecola marina]|uniref:DUF3014 domain-containing protein n=1 Tax=Paraglaciecola marina TaxID=2500157 RepID=UPI00105E0D9B|nr:DUF3014 domain-containing protein [Paraglaciecola marina]